MTKMRVIHSMDEIPTDFPDDHAEAEFWATHELSAELARQRLLKDAPDWLPPMRPPDEAPSAPAERGQPLHPSNHPS